LLAAATETGLLSQLEQALPPPPAPPEPPLLPLAGSPAVRQRLLLTLLLLGVVGLYRTWDLRGYTADGLALLTGRTRAYGYRYTEAFLSQIARADGAERWTSALAAWTTRLWHSTEGTGEAEHPSALTYYVDGHRKPVYSDVLIPRGLIGRLGVVLGCRALLLLHDEQGHPLFVTTHRGDQHLITGIPTFLARYEQHVGNTQIARMIVDREGMATDFLAGLHEQGRRVVTILQTNQYQDLSSLYVKVGLGPLDQGSARKCLAQLRTAGERLSPPHGLTDLRRSCFPGPLSWDYRRLEGRASSTQI